MTISVLGNLSSAAHHQPVENPASNPPDEWAVVGAVEPLPRFEIADRP
jgi:hypothetical protein